MEQFELQERIVDLLEAGDRTLEQRQLEEFRELQEEDISRLHKLKQWLKENLAAASALDIGVASLITSVVIGARTPAVKSYQATHSFAEAVKKAIMKLGLNLS